MLALATGFLLALVNPALPGREGVDSLLIIITMEFFIIHATIFLDTAANGPGSRRQRLGFLLAFALFYVPFFAGYSYVFDVWWPALMFLAMTLSRIGRISLDRGTDAGERRLAANDWALSMGLYVTCLGGAVLLVHDSPYFPAGAVWPRPEALLAGGFLYYLLSGLATLLRPAVHQWRSYRAEVNRLHRNY